ncbi:cysteine--tRNA ligase [Candidatus Desantisbacteria bacterium CG2_30_40_21]|uniref:Cysteine--tRNA ligase n=5 Tax=unclassified Candidatus Desantisiibacteriota TaxID=3106372 RepID=A0A2M7JAM9_9BACT|nr:MAG: cysteine--tRNA ligase [Candidatus Desantisbacteria bacterium CG2_30_40_21]PIP39754.1 MAG: cysteine--tRNA ligase [Candidatus Desantisbacteria bacterium CG23_combo_of_CG06-09_8_20_14_all_40_23]PIX16460.1 MAG: cysteine--tRNA ligase [Candidatus Desantisbacteria bacterium CG_4_8_14_3_um_filter_40_12]PIY20001.1 MAG: cysteine--tRNA ligase [Candidatus Desantisbacteria bacterium CG_4_10_14_3_um_filter_40_18]PJB28910.1 MAG: cysteine--tRNA ligase [Candidatus Desantisbacteria bacterium CG_4_9_14_3_
MKIYNTLTKTKEPFIPLITDRVGMYVCGITPYDSCHVGHARCYVAFDVIRRYLEYSGYVVTHIQNFTDIDDKIINRARERNVSPSKLSKQYEDEYFTCMDSLGIKRADEYPKVTKHIPEIIEFVQVLINKGHAYVLGGSVYFEVSSFPEYGKLSGRRVEDLLAGARVEVDEQKRHPADFALWKNAKPEEPSWDSPWGKGRPGWHIECSAMSQKYLGNTFDIHGGGQDLIFPHHENEIAQSEGYTGQQFAKYWIHNGFVTVHKEKMSKSLGNFFVLKEALSQYHPQIVRLFLLTTHYRSPMDFSPDKLDMTKASLERVYNLTDKLREMGCFGFDMEESIDRDNVMKHHPYPEAYKCVQVIQKTEERFKAAMDDDFNFPEALAVIHELITVTNKLISLLDAIDVSSVADNEATAIVAAGKQCLKYSACLLTQLAENVLGIRVQRERLGQGCNGQKTLTDGLMQLIIDLRQTARETKNFQMADIIRDRLKALGVTLEDTAEGTRWK